MQIKVILSENNSLCSLFPPLFSISSYVLNADKGLRRFSPVTWKVGLSSWLWQEKRSNEETL